MLEVFLILLCSSVAADFCLKHFLFSPMKKLGFVLSQPCCLKRFSCAG